jgi:hypothetical protein
MLGPHTGKISHGKWSDLGYFPRKTLRGVDWETVKKQDKTEDAGNNCEAINKNAS